MNRIPLEILINIGSHLDQVDHIECCLVCKLWKTPFQTLLFKKANFTEEDQLTIYSRQKPSLKLLTTSIVFDTFISEKKLEKIAKATPNVTKLKIEYDATDEPSKISTIIVKYWWKNLVKIDMFDDIMSVVLPLLSHQLEGVTGIFRDFFYSNGKLLPMPKLTALNIVGDEREEYSSNCSAKLLNDMRIAYPKLKKISLSGIPLEPVDDISLYSPLPFVESLNLNNCYDAQDSLRQWGKMFTCLKKFRLNHFGSAPEQLSRSDNPYYEFFNGNPMLNDLLIDYFGGMAHEDGFPAIKKLPNLTKLNLLGYNSTDVITDRELFDLDLFLSSAPSIKWLRIDGLFHISTGESFDNYLCGTDGYCDLYPTTTYRRSDKIVTTTTKYISKVKNSFYNKTFGNGERLTGSGSVIKTVKKKLPQRVQSETNYPMYTWNETKPKYSRMFDSPKANFVSHPLTALILLKTTLRNPTYRWIAQYLPQLTGLYVNHSEPYPFCEIVLGEKISRFLISFDDRYVSYEMPITRLKKFNSQKERTVAWIPERKVLETVQPLNEMDPATFAIDITYISKPSYFTVSEHNLIHVFNEIELE